MPLNLFKPFSSPSRGDGEGFFQRGFRRHGRSHEDSKHGYPSIRRQVLTRGFRGNDETEEVILPIPPPNFSRPSDRSDTDTSSFDSESYVDVPRTIREPSIHRAPSMHGTPTMHGTMPVVQREEYDPNAAYEPSIHHFGVPPSAEDEYSDMGESPISDSPRYPMGGYSGRDMMHEPVDLDSSPVARSESVDLPDNDHYMGDGRRHPAFANSHPVHSTFSSRPSSIPSARPHELSYPDSFTPPVRQRDMAVDPDPYGRGHPEHEHQQFDEPQRQYQSPRHQYELPQRQYESPQWQYESPQRHYESRAPDTYYIVPAGTNVIFQDEDGNEITRVGDFSGRPSRRPRREAPLIVQDEHGRELYRTPGYGTSTYGGRSDRVSYMDHYGSSQGSEMSSSSPGSPNVILLDHYGRQIPLTNPSGSMSSGSNHSSSYRTGYSSASGR